jgi:hypothetical protein
MEGSVCAFTFALCIKAHGQHDNFRGCRQFLGFRAYDSVMLHDPEL